VLPFPICLFRSELEWQMQYLIKILLLCCLFSTGLKAQLDSLYELEVVTVLPTDIRTQSLGSAKQTWDIEELRALPATNVAELLSNESGIYIKNSGGGSLATSSIRGGSAGHTLVLWNGLPIQSPMLGLLDLSLLPIVGVEEVTMQKGGNSAMWGSGAIGGVIGLNSKANFENKYSVSAGGQVGSFGEKQGRVRFGGGNERWQSMSKVSFQRADNDFDYFLADGLPRRIQENAYYAQQDFLQDVYLKIGKRSQVGLNFWQQFAYREIPPLNTQTRSEANQKDQSSRLVASWQLVNKSAVTKAKVGFFTEKQNYDDPLFQIQALNQFQTYFAEVYHQWTWRKSQWVLGATQNYTVAQSENYEDNPSESKTAFFTSYQWEQNKWHAELSLRQELVDLKAIPLVPVAALNYRLNEYLVLKSKVSKNYRLPTLNDRFWNPGGNPDLLPESGWSEELSIVSGFAREKHQLYVEAVAFNRNIDNWIFWSNSNSSFYSPQNITKVWSRGAELRCRYTYEVNDFKLKLDAGFFFTPKSKAHGRLSTSLGSYQLSYQHIHTGASTGLNDNIPAFQVGNLRMQYQIQKDKWNASLFVNINNVWNVDYLIVERRPMPGRFFQTGINFNFSKTHNN